MGKEEQEAGQGERKCRGVGFDENIGNREDRKIFIFSDTSRKKGMRERACGADSSLDRGST